MRRLTAKYNSPMPAIDSAFHHLLSARALDTRLKNEGVSTLEAVDWSSLVAGTRVAAGLDGFDKKKVIRTYLSQGVYSSLLHQGLEHCFSDGKHGKELNIDMTTSTYSVIHSQNKKCWAILLYNDTII